MFALVDCNNFYASCERVFKPELNGRPVVVLSNNDGCVIARSNEAKAMGIPMGAPAFKYQEFFAKNNITVFSSNYALYGDMSSRVMSILSSYTPDIEIYSIDEAFLNFTGFDISSLEAMGTDMKSKVGKWTGIPVSVGFAATKTLAKAANKIAKKFPDRTGGVYIIDSEEKREKALKWLPIGDVWGIGSRNSKKLIDIGVRKAWDLTQLSDYWVKKNMSIVGLRLKWELEGKPALEMESIQSKKSIATTRSFDSICSSYDELRERVVTYAVCCAEKLRKQQSCCNSMMVFLQTNYFRQDLPQANVSTVIKFPYSTSSSIEIAKFAIEGLSRIVESGYHYKRAGVILMDIVPENPNQLNMFENSNAKHKVLMNVIDKINAQVGNRKVLLAAEDPGRRWKMKQERLSPRYTTKIEEIITIQI